jgi:hypothetical protein
VLPEYVGVRDIPDEELAFPHDLLKSCSWDENLDRLTDPAGNILQKTLKARSTTPVGFKYPFPSDRWPTNFPRPAPQYEEEDETDETSPERSTEAGK